MGINHRAKQKQTNKKPKKTAKLSWKYTEINRRIREGKKHEVEGEKKRKKKNLSLDLPEILDMGGQLFR